MNKVVQEKAINLIEAHGIPYRKLITINNGNLQESNLRKEIIKEIRLLEFYNNESRKEVGNIINEGLLDGLAGLAAGAIGTVVGPIKSKLGKMLVDLLDVEQGTWAADAIIGFVEAVGIDDLMDMFSDDVDACSLVMRNLAQGMIKTLFNHMIKPNVMGMDTDNFFGKMVVEAIKEVFSSSSLVDGLTIVLCQMDFGGIVDELKEEIPGASLIFGDSDEG
jgi:hypothetical protein